MIDKPMPAHYVYYTIEDGMMVRHVRKTDYTRGRLHRDFPAIDRIIGPLEPVEASRSHQ